MVEHCLPGVHFHHSPVVHTHGVLVLHGQEAQVGGRSCLHVCARNIGALAGARAAREARCRVWTYIVQNWLCSVLTGALEGQWRRSSGSWGHIDLDQSGVS